MRKRESLIPESSMADPVTHAELQAELTRLRAAISLLASRLGNELGSDDARRILELVAPPYDR
jgi:hypothetical protein